MRLALRLTVAIVARHSCNRESYAMPCCSRVTGCSPGVGYAGSVPNPSPIRAQIIPRLGQLPIARNRGRHVVILRRQSSLSQDAGLSQKSVGGRRVS